jgi:hypothetical protein
MGASVAEQLSGRPGDQPSPLELEFGRRWRSMVDRVGGDGGQARVAESLKWTTSTASRDYNGETLPTDERLLQLCRALRLPDREMLELSALLRRARAARRDRLRALRAESPGLLPDAAASAGSGAAVTSAWPASGPVTPSGTAAVPGSPRDAGPPQGAGPPPSLGGQHVTGRRTWFRGRRLAAVLSVAAVPAVVAAVLVFILSGSGAPRAKPAAQAKTPASTRPVAKGAFPGLALVSVRIPVRSLSPALAAQVRQGQTLHALMVTGFEFRNRGATGLCLTAVNTGAKAGKNHDPVLVDTCAGAPNQIWIPLQWQVDGFRFTHLVNDQYQSMCLNADNRGGGMRQDRIVQLWDCYPAGNEAWDFGDWRTAVSGGRAYPLFARSGRLCLDADKYDLRDGTPVRLWNQYRAANQFWS